ncbi:TetR/AcrR family transcriptional regulator [Occultella glacieicola]|nr:TetR/AcrR family transcriptional regulator [Occultella glacieicola]
MIDDVLTVARRQLGEVGAAGLSLRSVTREVGISPSAVYRYFSSRDHILTGLILEGYTRLGTAVTAADDALPPDRVTTRWHQVWHSTRDWAVANPHEYALLYGTPVIGYDAPPETVEPATRVVVRLTEIFFHAARRDLLTDRVDLSDPAPTPGLREDAESLLRTIDALGVPVPAGLDPADPVRVVNAWSELFGAISFELFGHYVRSITRHAEHLDTLAAATARQLGLPERD